MRMCKCLTIIGAAVLALSGAAVAGPVTGTPHDFSDDGWSGGQICLPCHTPHNAKAGVGYLWNHAIPTDADFTKYEEGAVLGMQSLTCLGCHDGQTAIDSIGNETGTELMTGSANIGRDLTNDHPVGVEYGTSSRRAPLGTVHGHAGVNIPAGSTRGLPLFGDDNRLECATCHSPHSNDNGNFLRVDNAGSALCIGCHTSHGS